MRDSVRKSLGGLTLVGGLGLLIFGARYYGGSSYSIAATLGMGQHIQLVGFIVSAILFFGCGIAVGASLEDDPTNTAK